MLASGATRRARPAAVRLWADLHAAEDLRGQQDKCARVVRALAAANKFILDKPDEALELLKKRFDKMDQPVLAAAWKTCRQAHGQGPPRHRAGASIHSQEVSLEAKLLEPKDAVKNFDGLYTDEFIK